ncbi:zinc finger MYM-type protein 1-like [Adelges cooleyi]|uniref:zinc finger MYM-type protein 1-like n=1 Tax=Adelges cooleyi TaxID=133065 RepID=UPI00217FE4C1|nr:zinc finger MYM-type protein 1-like [Adelges cooleyi]
MNSVQEILKLKFSSLTLEQKVEIKNLGRPLPNLSNLLNISKKGKTSYNRHFNTELYQKHKWLCGCETTVSLFCFPCVCFGGDKSWSKTGVKDLIHLLAKINKHENSFKHLQNEADFKMLGTIDTSKIDSGYKLEIKRHNEQVAKNRDILEKILNCVKFCGNHELPLRGHDEKISSKNQGVFHGLINLCSDLDPRLREHFQKSIVCTSKTIKNELLDCILNVTRNHILNEINNSEFVSIIVDETTDIFNKFQSALIFRYEINGKPVERFWGFCYPHGHDADSLTQTILKEIDPILEKYPQKLIAQAYDGAAVMSGQKSGVNVRVQEKYPYAYFSHCYAHQLKLIMAQATSQNKQVKLFFSNLSQIPTFFSNSPQRVAILDEIVSTRLPKTVQKRWNFNIQTVNKVYEHRETLIKCMEKIIDVSSQSATINQATGLLLLLKDSTFIFWLDCFHKIMPHVDCLYKAVQSQNIDPVQIQNSVITFKIEIQKIHDDITSSVEELTFENSSKRQRTDDTVKCKKSAALQVCDLISIEAQRRFDFTKHLTAAQLFQNEKYVKYNNNFPFATLNTTVECYPFFVQERLINELKVFYSRDDFLNIKGVIPIINYITNANMEDTFKEVFKLLKILVVTPMTSSEAERSFSTLKRIKTCLKSNMGEDRLDALTMLSVESHLINEDIVDFNKKVIDDFCIIKERSLDFQYKNCT